MQKMPNFTLIKIKVQAIIAKTKSSLDVRQHPARQALTFGLILGVIGGFIIWHSLAASPVPAPTNLTETTQPNGTVNLSWNTPNDQNVTSYKIYEESYTSDPAPNDTGTASSSPILDLVRLTGHLIGTTTQTNYQVTGLLTDRVHNLYVVGVDS